jgi:hypothetical protein
MSSNDCLLALAFWFGSSGMWKICAPSQATLRGPALLRMAARAHENCGCDS